MILRVVTLLMILRPNSGSNCLELLVTSFLQAKPGGISFEDEDGGKDLVSGTKKKRVCRMKGCFAIGTRCLDVPGS